jgi:hypothetical protein
MKVSSRIIRMVTIGLAVLAFAAPAASAVPATPDSPAPGGEQIAIEPEPPIVQSVDQGFDWGSAAIGAGLAGGLVLLVSWGGVTYRHRHEHAGRLAH